MISDKVIRADLENIVEIHCLSDGHINTFYKRRCPNYPLSTILLMFIVWLWWHLAMTSGIINI